MSAQVNSSDLHCAYCGVVVETPRKWICRHPVCDACIKVRTDEVADEYHHADLNNPRFRSIAEYALDLPKAHALLVAGFTLCGLRDSFTFSTDLDAVDCPDCLTRMKEQTERADRFPKCSHVFPEGKEVHFEGCTWVVKANYWGL